MCQPCVSVRRRLAQPRGALLTALPVRTLDYRSSRATRTRCTSSHSGSSNRATSRIAAGHSPSRTDRSTPRTYGTSRKRCDILNTSQDGTLSIGACLSSVLDSSSHIAQDARVCRVGEDHSQGCDPSQKQNFAKPIHVIYLRDSSRPPQTRTPHNIVWETRLRQSRCDLEQQADSHLRASCR